MSEDHRAPASPALKERVSRETSRAVVRTVEWAGLVYQLGALLWTVLIDPYSPVGKVVLAFLVPVHVALLPTYVRGRGPFSRGGWWVPVAVAASLGMNGVVAWAAPPGTYGNPWFYMSSYSSITFGLLACYPWAHGWRSYWRVFVELALLGTHFGWLLMLSVLTSGPIADARLRSLLSVMMWPVLGYILGKALLQVAVLSTTRQLEVQRQSFFEFFDFLHSDVKAAIAAVRKDPRVADAQGSEGLKQLDEAVGHARVNLLFAMDQIPLAELLSTRVRLFANAIHIARCSAVGGESVPRPVGLVVGRALGDLLTNAVVHGAKTVAIDLVFDGGRVVLRIDDDGPGFADEVLDNASTSLYRLRQSARDLGGDLRKSVAALRGTSIILDLPVHVAT